MCLSCLHAHAAVVHCVRPSRGFVPAADPLSCIDKKGGKEATPASSALAARGLPCAARSLRPRPTHFVRCAHCVQTNGAKSVHEARLRARRKALCCSARPKGKTNTRYTSLRIGAKTLRCARARCEARWDRESCEATTVLLLGPVGGVEERRGLGPRAQHASSTDFARLFERSERSERSEFCARPHTPSTAEQSALGRPPPSGPPFFGDFLLAKQKKVTALSGAHPDAASRSEQPSRKSRTRLRYLSPNGRWWYASKGFDKLSPNGLWFANTRTLRA